MAAAPRHRCHLETSIACWPVHANLLLSLPCVTKLLKHDVAEPELKATIFIFFYIYLGEYVILVLSKQTWQIYTCFG